MTVPMLHVDYDLLNNTAQSLAALKEDFSTAGDTKESIRDELGSEELADAMDEFVGNWDRHRRLLTEAMAKLEKTTRSAVATFEKADVDIGHSLQAETHSGSTPPAGGPR